MIRFVAGAREPPSCPYDADVTVLALDRLDDTVAAVRSALSQNGVRRHVTVLDQGSQPENLVWLAATVAGRDDATLLRSDRNLGVAGGRNAASAFGHGRIIVGIDNDAEFAAVDTLAGMVAALDAEPGLAALGCRILNHWSGDDDLTSWGYPKSLLPHAGGTFLATTFVGAGHAIRREAWDDAGGYDERLFFCWEEFDFCLRAVACGWKIRYRGDLAVRHKVSSEGRVRWSGARWYQFVRNRLYIGRKQGYRWWELTPRALAYLAKGARNGLTCRTVAAIAAAVGMPTDRLPRQNYVAAYLRAHDQANRETLIARVRSEVLVKL